MGKKRKRKITVGKDMEKLELSYNAGGNVKWCSHFKKAIWQFLKQLNIELPYDPGIPVLAILLKRNGNIQPQKNEYLNIHSNFSQ